MKSYDLYSDEELVELKNDEARTALLRRVLPIIKSLSADFDTSGIPGYDQDDLIQESCLAFLYAEKKYDKSRGAAFRTFLYTCVRSHLSKLKKKNKKGNDHSFVSIFDKISDADADTRYVDIIADNETTDEEVIREDLSAAISDHASKILSKNELTIFRMFYIDGCKTKEIAEKLGCETKSVENALYRIRVKLKKSLNS